MPHRFVIMISGQLHEFDCYENIPDRFDHVIEFCPEIPPGPHTHAQHHEIEKWNDVLMELLRREHAGSGEKR